jgi:cysteine sulfinate desulfinase/cysteine desulfurase-like protein
VIATSNLTRTQKETIARSEARDRQVAIKCKMESIQQLTEKELTTMVTQALQPPTDRDRHPVFYCCSVRKTKGEVVLLEMSNKQEAK